MPVKPLWLAFVLVTGLNLAVVHADEPTLEEEDAATLEFLEFLGDWETEDGEWVDPEELEQIETIDQEQDDNDDQ